MVETVTPLEDDVAELRTELRELRTAVFGLDPDRPGVTLRVDRLERLVRMAQILAATGIFWQLLQVVGEILKGVRTT